MLAPIVAALVLAASADSVPPPAPGGAEVGATSASAPASTMTADQLFVPDGPPMPPVRVVRLSGPVQVDGVLNEPVWSSAPPVTNFTQRDPDEGIRPSQRTEVRMAYDDDAIYVAARLYDDAPDSILARLARRDVSIPADRFSVYLDPYHDKRSGYYFMVNAAGTLYDGTLSNDGWEDNSWDGVWDARARRDAGGWVAEFRIPFSQMRYQNRERNVWGVNFRRVIQRRSEEAFLVFQPKQGSGFVSRFPELLGLDGLRAPRSLEVIPYVTGKSEFSDASPGDPFNDGTRHTGSAGGDLRTGVGSRLTLNATVNPDFGQVEVDPAIVNLSDVETFYPEKRPFFVEGSSNFRFGNEGANSYSSFNWPEPIFFYSRRIGRAPQGGYDGEDPASSYYVDAPIGTTILGAAKLTGKITPSTNFGTLHALTAREQVDISNAGVESRQDIEPLSYYGAIRGLKEFSHRQHGLGAMVNLASRSFDDASLADQLNRNSLVYGLDGWSFLDKKQDWVVSGWFSGSYVNGTTTAMTSLQENSRHYFQRPDVGYLGVDANATSLAGYGGRLWLNKQNGPWILNAGLGAMSPKFDVNDLGFMSRTDLTNSHVMTGYRWTKPTKYRKYQEVLAAVFGGTDFGGTMISSGVWASGYTEFQNNYSWDYRAAYNPPHRYSSRLARGGPYIAIPEGYELGTYFDTDGKQKLFFYLDANGYAQPSADSWNAYVEPGLEWKPVSNFSLRVGPSLERVAENAQYVDTIDDPTSTVTYGHRYLFSTLDQTTVAANIRLNVAFTPNVSIQFYGQPLFSSGDYSGYKELARGRTYDFNVYGEANQSTITYDASGNVYTVDPDGPGPAPAFGIGNPDFSYVSLRGNAVLRWEYRSGSTVYFVWTHQASDASPLGDFDFDASKRLLGDAPGDDIFLLKLTYYLGL